MYLDLMFLADVMSGVVCWVHMVFLFYLMQFGVLPAICFRWPHLLGPGDILGGLSALADLYIWRI